MLSIYWKVAFRTSASQHYQTRPVLAIMGLVNIGVVWCSRFLLIHLVISEVAMPKRRQLLQSCGTAITHTDLLLWSLLFTLPQAICHRIILGARNLFLHVLGRTHRRHWRYQRQKEAVRLIVSLASTHACHCKLLRSTSPFTVWDLYGVKRLVERWKRCCSLVVNALLPYQRVKSTFNSIWLTTYEAHQVVKNFNRHHVWP